MSKVIVSDKQRCLGCKSCEIACALAHAQAETLEEAVRGGQRLQPRVHVVPLEDGSMPLQCRHCADAPCIVACPTGAIRRFGDNGPVVLDADSCIGCHFCVLVCPFGVIEESADGKAVSKCDLCIERTEAGGVPACVEACPTCGLKFVEIESVPQERRREAALRLARSEATVIEEPER